MRAYQIIMIRIAAQYENLPYLLKFTKDIRESDITNVSLYIACLQRFTFTYKLKGINTKQVY